MTGSIGPAEFGGVNPPLLNSPCEAVEGIVHATKGMKKFLDGSVRLSGAVNLMSFPGVITFSCMFVLED